MGIDRDELQEPECCEGELECPVCRGLPVEAMVCPACEHVFCRLCIERALEGDPKCPTCRRRGEIGTYAANHLVNLRVNSTVVCCERRCGWYGRRDARWQHAKVCPVRAAYEFVIPLRGHLGLNLETTTNQHLVVGCLSDTGAALDYNKRVEHDISRQIRPGCDIVEANGIRGDCHELLYVMQRTAKQNGLQLLVFKRPTEFCTTVTRNSKEFGLELALKEAGSSFLEILSVIPGGAVMDHNSNNADEKLKSHDRIVEVNGVRGDGRDILRCMQRSDTCEMRICRLQ